MPKYYVESNDLKVVLVANKPLEACVKAMSLLLNKTPKELSNLAFIIDTESEHIIDTDKVIDCL